MKVLKTRNIDVFPKNTSAGTQYWDMDARDEAYIYQWLYRLVSDMSEQCTIDEDLRRDWYKRRPSQFPKGKNGPNSFASMLGGICSAKIQNPNKNLSDPQLDAVETYFNIIAQYYADETDPPIAIRFVKKLFTVEK